MQEKREARTLFQRGLRAFSLQRYPDALALFTASYRLVPKSVVLYNIAMCHRALFEYSKAIRAFRDYLARRGAKLPFAKRRQVAGFVKEMEGKLGHLKLVVEPDGAEVRVDGLLVGKTPLAEAVPLDPGRRIVLVSHPARRPATLQLTVVGGQLISMGVRLQQPIEDGRLVLSCGAPRCTVQVEDGPRQSLPITLSLPAGDRRLRVEAPGYLPQAIVVRVISGETVTRQVDLVASGPGFGSGGGGRSGGGLGEVPIVKRWWFWTVISAAALAVAGTTTGLVLWDQSRARTRADVTWQLP